MLEHQNAVRRCDRDRASGSAFADDDGDQRDLELEALFGGARDRFGLTALPGNLRRRELVEYYARLSGRDIRDLVFYFAYGLLKIDSFCRSFSIRSRSSLFSMHSYSRMRSPIGGWRIALALAGSLALEGGVVQWVADHRRHHAYADREGDPHSPWRYGETVPALTKGLAYAHLGWMFNAEQTPQRQYAPDLLKDRDIVRLSKLFPMWVFISLALPPVIGGLVTWSWQGAATAFFWGSLVRLFLVHHVTWSINSICHTMGESPFKSRDHSGNVWWLAIPSMGESWHNLHHADPTCARHGVLPGQVDISARVIWLFEKAGWVRDVRWPVASRIEAKRVEATANAAA